MSNDTIWRVGTAVQAVRPFTVMLEQPPFTVREVRTRDEGKVTVWTNGTTTDLFVMVKFQHIDSPVIVSKEHLAQNYELDSESRHFRESEISRRDWDWNMARVERIWAIQKNVWDSNDDQQGWRILHGIEQLLGRKPEVEELTPDLLMEGLRQEYAVEWIGWYERKLTEWKATQS